MAQFLASDTIGLTFDDVSMVPGYSEVEHRAIDVDLSQPFKIGKTWTSLRTPLISSPMDTVSEEQMAKRMSLAGGFSVIHRYCTIDRQVEIVKKSEAVDSTDKPFRIVGAAVGATADFYERAQALLEAGAKIICVDVAHGNHIIVKRAMEKLQDLRSKYDFHLMVGNAAEGSGFMNLVKWGADSVRLSVGSGSICSTRLQTGHGVPNFGAILDCVRAWESQLDKSGIQFRWNNHSRPKLILDGGIRKSGDIVKAIAAGADMVMCGSLFAGTDEAPGEVLDVDGRKGKRYSGMASRVAQNNWRGTSSAPEGISTIIPYKGSVGPILEDTVGQIKSGFSYSGARNIYQLWKKAVFIRQSPASQQESNTHILNTSLTGAG